MRSNILVILLLLTGLAAFGQANESSSTLDSIVVRSALGRQTLLRSTATVSIIDSAALLSQHGGSLLPVVNTVAGVRMEERSPLSYRLSIRGSLLRSPFGVRNVKLYLDEVPLTDASGNSYLNFIPAGSLGRMEIFKGPDGSLYGANSGGVVLLHTGSDAGPSLRAGLHAGSFDTYGHELALSVPHRRHAFQVYASIQGSEGYREQSAASRIFMKAQDRWQYSSRNSLEASFLYGQLHYETPGGLTREQYDADPRKARYPTATLPGAVTQQAGIYGRMIMGSLAHRAALSKGLSHTAIVFANGVNIRNPFITNYEARDESTFGLRSFITYSPQTFLQEANLGIEWQQTGFATSVYDNNGGERGNFRSASDIRARQHFLFLRTRYRLGRDLSAEASVSLNHYRYQYEGDQEGAVSFDPQLMPRLSVNWVLLPGWSLRGIVSKGYAVPNLTDLFNGSGVINSELQPEGGWNFESGLRFSSLHNRLFFDAAVFHFRLRNAIVRRVDAGGNDYFINAGGTTQKGLEVQGTYKLLQRNDPEGWQLVQLGFSHTFSHFHFDAYGVGNEDYSGNAVTGVPRHVSVASVQAGWRGLQLTGSMNHTSKLPLNDANTAYADAYSLLRLQLEWRVPVSHRMELSFYAGGDNLLDEKYSLGHDLNAAGNRYYNAAAGRNYFGGLKLKGI